MDDFVEEGADGGHGLVLSAVASGWPSVPDDLDLVLPCMWQECGESLDGSASIGQAGPSSSEEKLLLLDQPTAEEQVQGMTEPSAGIGAELSVQCADFLELPVSLAHLFALGPFASPAGPTFFRHAVQDAGEVEVTGSHLAAAGSIAQPPFRFLDVFQGVDSVCADELLSRAGHLVAAMDVFEEQAFGSPLGLGMQPLYFDEVVEFFGIDPGAGMREKMTALVIDLKQGLDQHLHEGPGQGGLSQWRDLPGQVVGEIDQGG
jgi:hypothetical protein